MVHQGTPPLQYLASRIRSLADIRLCSGPAQFSTPPLGPVQVVSTGPVEPTKSVSAMRMAATAAPLKGREISVSAIQKQRETRHVNSVQLKHRNTQQKASFTRYWSKRRSVIQNSLCFRRKELEPAQPPVQPKALFARPGKTCVLHHWLLLCPCLTLQRGQATRLP